MGDYFVDREDISNDIENNICSSIGNTAYILYAMSGIGKSAFCHQVLKQMYEKYKIPGIKVSIPVGANISIDEGYYFRELVKECSDKCKIYGYMPFSEYLKKNDSPLVNRILSHQVADNFQGLSTLVKPLIALASYIDGSDYFDENLYYSPSDDRYVYIILVEYLRYVLKKYNRFIINIENIQQVDIISLQKLQELLKNESNIFLMLEYTISSENDRNDVYSFMSNFDNFCDNKYIKKLTKLDFDNTCKLLSYLYQNNDIISDRENLHQIYLQIEGNLRKLSDIENVFEIYDENPSILSEDYTDITIANLTATQLQILCLVATHSAMVDESILKQLLIEYNKYQIFVLFEKEMNVLINEKRLLKVKDNIIQLSHDSILSVLKHTKYMPKMDLAVSWWVEFYEKQLKTDSSYDASNIEIVKKLCFFYCQNDMYNRKIIKLFPQIRILALNSINPEAAVAFLSDSAYAISEINDIDICNRHNEFLMKLYYELGLFEHSYNYIDSINMNQKQKFLYKVALLDRLQHNEDAVCLINQELKDTADTHYQLCLQLIKMISEASNNRYDSCLSIFKDIEENDKYHNYIEYGFLLRNSEIVLPIKQSLQYIHKSIDFFNERNLILYEAYSHITLAMSSARIGFFEDARQAIKKAKILLSGQTLERHILLNDEAAIEMCSGNYNVELIYDLILASSTAVTTFDRLIINKNLLILYKKNKLICEGEELVNYLLELIELENDKLNICYTYWVISYFYKNMNNEKYQNYYKKYQEIFHSLVCSSIRQSALESEVYHKPNMEYVIGFISYWHFPIPEDLIDD